MTLDPEVRTLLHQMAAQAPTTAPSSAAELRASFAASLRIPDDLEPVASVTDEHVQGPGGDLRVRIYRPDVAGKLPVFLWWHGGGWTIGSIEDNEVASRAVCNAAGVAVVAAEYRLAPENPFPAAPADSYAVLEWVAATAAQHGLDAERIAVGGESAGGNLSAVTAMMSRDRGGPSIRAQVLICPVCGHPDDGRPSYTDCATGYSMTADSMRFFFDQYPSHRGDLDDPYLLPLRASDLTGLPRALVLTAEYDVLRDEGEDLARSLRDAGTAVELTRYTGQIHGFHALHTDLPASARSHAQVADFLRRVLD